MKKIALIFLFATSLSAQVQLSKGVQIGGSGGGGISNFSATGTSGITTSVTSPTTTPALTVGVDSGHALPTTANVIAWDGAVTTANTALTIANAAVHPSGAITAGHCASWVTGTTLGDAGAACGAGTAGSFLGTYNSDSAISGGGNNGVANLIATSCASISCTIVIPATSTSTENVASLTIPQNVVVWDLRPATYGMSYAACPSASADCNVQNFINTSATYPFSGGLEMFDLFAPPHGFSLGNIGGSAQGGGEDWSGSHLLQLYGDVQSSGIAETMTIYRNKYAAGDFTLGYWYGFDNGGATAQSDESTKALGIHIGQPELDEGGGIWAGTASSGVSTGATLLPVTSTGVAKYPSQDSFLEDQNPAHALTCAISGSDLSTTPVISGSNVYSAPVSGCTLPVSTAYGTTSAPFNQPNSGLSSTANFTLTLGPGSGAFTTGVATLAGNNFIEQVNIVAGSVSGGLQGVTVTYKFPESAGNTSLWQGGLANYDINLDRNVARDGWPQAFQAVGAIDSSHIAYSVNALGNTNGNTLHYYIAPVTPYSMTRDSTGLVTFYANGGILTGGQASVTISGSGSTPTMDGTCTGVKTLFNSTQVIGATCQESTATAVTTPSTTAIVTIPNVNNVHLYPYCTISGPMQGNSIPCEPNTVAWSSGDILQNPAYPVSWVNGIGISANKNTPDYGAPSVPINIEMHGVGLGSNEAHAISWQNFLPTADLQGHGGTLGAPTAVESLGAFSNLIDTQWSPEPGFALLSVGPSISNDPALPSPFDDGHAFSVFRYKGSGTYGEQDITFEPTIQSFLINNLITGNFTTNVLNVPQIPNGLMTVTDGVAGSVSAINNIEIGATTPAPGNFTSLEVSGNPVCQLNGSNCPASSGGVTQLVAGTGISLSPSGGTGTVTVTATGSGGGVTGSYVGSSLTSAVSTASVLTTPTAGLYRIDLAENCRSSGSGLSVPTVVNYTDTQGQSQNFEVDLTCTTLGSPVYISGSANMQSGSAITVSTTSGGGSFPTYDLRVAATQLTNH